MNKKVLVLTLALIVAFAGSAMAEVKFSGKFTATAEQTNFQVFKEGYSLSPKLEFNISATNKDVTETTKLVEKTEVDKETGETITVLESEIETITNWDFTGAVKFDGKEWALGKYKLHIQDNYFEGWAWGNEQELTDKATYFDMIKAGKKAGKKEMRARLLVPVLDLADVTVDFKAPDNIRVFTEGTIEGYNVGLAYARTEWTNEDKIANVLVAQVGAEVPAGEYSIDAKVAAGITLGDDLGFALGLGAETDITEELEVEASVTTANEHWKGDNLKAKDTVLKAGATYTEDQYQVDGSVKHTLTKDANKGKNEITLGAKYRMSEKIAYNRLFNTGSANPKWYDNDAPAFGVDVKFVDFKFDNVEAKAAAPVVDNMVWAMATGKYLGGSKFEATARAHVLATDKLTLKP
ncbi:MAG: porin, partial [Firmicutes bacterium]|nr:porin [Bacillota bacterium]